MKNFLEKIEGFTLEEYNDGTSVLLNSNSGIVHLLNTTATLLYKLCDSKVEKDDLFNRFLSEIDLYNCEVSLNEVKSDFEDVIKEFVERGILLFE